MTRPEQRIPAPDLTPVAASRSVAYRGGRLWRRLALALGLLTGFVLLLVLGIGLWLHSRLRASLPQLSGERVMALAAPVIVERDALGVPTVRAVYRLDAARATGFVHAQDRMFQMDFLRRRAAGELSELLGTSTLAVDKAIRVHRLRAVARAAFARLSPSERALLVAYTEGVNTGRAALAEKPFEYLLLGSDPAPWLPEDSLLVILAMHVDLQDEAGILEMNMGLLYELLPRQLFEFLTPSGTEWDAPLQGRSITVPDIPGPDVFSLRNRSHANGATVIRPSAPRPWTTLRHEGWEPEAVSGSNAWAVDGLHAADGMPLLANDLHLPLAVPNVWYRLSLVWRGESGKGEHRVVGASLPGLPLIVIGSNRHIAWGLTNAQVDTGDLILVELDPADRERYLTPQGPRRFEHHREVIRKRGGRGRSETLDTLWTIWGPVLGKDHRGRLRALRWTAHDPAALNLGMARLETATTLERAMDVAHRSGAPTQNIVIAEASGRVGWTLLGSLPRRVGFNGQVPSSWADGRRRWQGFLAPAEYPRIVNPPSGRVWSANHRALGYEWLSKVSDGGFVLGARARQIRDRLLLLERATPRDMLALQLDDRALFLARWRDLLLRTLDREALAIDPRRRTLRRLVEDWEGRAAVDAVGYRFVRDFRHLLLTEVFAPITAACKRTDPSFEYRTIQQAEGPLWELVSRQPIHLLDPRYRTWRERLLAAVDALIAQAEKEEMPLSQRTWGHSNTAAIRHPFSRALPVLGCLLDMPAQPLPGDVNMPRVQRPSMGASLRMVVSPGHEERGFFQMPGGQSGHPLSIHYRDSHHAWVEGGPTPFLPGAAVHVLRLVPASAGTSHAGTDAGGVE